ncbi:MAG: YfbK domain-containing protein [Chitinophagaceae bacterium]
MKRVLLLALFIFISVQATFAQYYLRGIVRDEKGNALTEVKIKLFSTGRYPLTNGNDGSFGFPTKLPIDTMYLNLDGYEPLKVALNTNQYNTVTMKLLNEVVSIRKNLLASKTKDLDVDAAGLLENSGESYSTLIENPFVKTQTNPETGFSLNVDRAAYSNIRRFINNGLTVPVDAVRIEEMLNYFDFRDSINIESKKITCKTYQTTCPWNSSNNLLFINSSFPKVNLDSVPASNLVFLIDISGSMERPNRLPLLQAAFKMLVDNLREKDKVAIVTYGGGVDVELASTSGAEKKHIKNVIDSLEAAGDTPGANAIKVAYAVAKDGFIVGGNNRVILATDGDFNVGQTTDKELEDIITIQKNSGIYLTCIGVGMGNYKDSKLETLAKKGNGNFAYLDNIQEAEKVLVKEFTKTVYAVAKDAFVSVKFNSNVIKQYRLIGFDNKKDAATDATSTMAGGEVGSGHSAVAVFEIEPVKSNSVSNDHIAEVLLQYKKERVDSSIVIKTFIANNKPVKIDSAEANLKLATALCMYGSLLKKSKYAKGFDLDDITNLVEPALKKDNYLHKEFLGLLEKTNEIYQLNKNKKKKKKKKVDKK